jgi:hypothetical protein
MDLLYVVLGFIIIILFIIWYYIDTSVILEESEFGIIINLGKPVGILKPGKGKKPFFTSSVFKIYATDPNWKKELNHYENKFPDFNSQFMELKLSIQNYRNTNKIYNEPLSLSNEIQWHKNTLREKLLLQGIVIISALLILGLVTILLNLGEIICALIFSVFLIAFIFGIAFICVFFISPSHIGFSKEGIYFRSNAEERIQKQSDLKLFGSELAPNSIIIDVYRPKFISWNEIKDIHNFDLTSIWNARLQIDSKSNKVYHITNLNLELYNKILRHYWSHSSGSRDSDNHS